MTDRTFESETETSDFSSRGDFPSVADVADNVTRNASDLLESGRRAASRGAAAAGDAARSAAERLPDARSFRDGASKMFDDTSDYLRNKSPQDMLADLQQQTKANPAAFLLGALAVGFIAGRMLRRS